MTNIPIFNCICSVGISGGGGGGEWGSEHRERRLREREKSPKSSCQSYQCIATFQCLPIAHQVPVAQHFHDVFFL